MLHFLSMTIENFGPYKGIKEVDFTSQPGVSIFWGDNGRGKTTLLNAFRYALFGRVERRYGSLKTIREMENRESREEGIFGFSISMKMRDEECVYELTRSFKPKANISIPKSDFDYEKNLFLKKDGCFLSQEEMRHTINTLMPEVVSRFFLFDGELLQEYENLVLDEMNSNDAIKSAIEQILGVPVLEYGTTDLESVAKIHSDEVMRIAQKDEKVKALSGRLVGHIEHINERKNTINRLKNELKTLTQEQKKLCETCKNTEQLRDWLISRDKNCENIKMLDKKEEDILNEIRKLSEVAWKWLLEERLNVLIENLSKSISGLENKKRDGHIAKTILKDFKKAITDKVCPTCTQPVENEILNLLKLKHDELERGFTGLTSEETDILDTLKVQHSSLKKIRTHNEKELFKKYEDDLRQIIVNKEDLRTRTKELDEKINRYKEEIIGIKELPEKLQKIQHKIAYKENAIRMEREYLEEDEQQRESLEEKIKKNMIGREAEVANKKSVLCEKVKKIFEQGKERYCQRLKENVEKDATILFKGFANDKGYAGLKINDNYGLNIVLGNGEIVPGRSSGYEHIVALSLIGALHKNAPLQGPIIMDSPFGRLDPTHKSNIVKALPHMAEQVILLVYTNEIDQQSTRETLGGALLSEKTLSYISSMHTDIV